MISPTEVAVAVRTYARGLAPITLSIRSIEVVPGAAQGRRYFAILAVYIEATDDILVSDVPVELFHAGATAAIGKIVGYERDLSLAFVAIRTLLDVHFILPHASDRRLKIYNDRLYEQLAQQIETLPSIPERFQSILQTDAANAGLIFDEDSSVVAEQLSRLATPWTRFLWGPPGAGKTFSLGRLALHLLQEYAENRILLLAPSNRATDVALEQLVSQLDIGPLRDLISQRRIVRFGYPRKPEIIERKELLGHVALDQLNEQARLAARKLARAEQENKPEQELAKLRARLLAAQEEVKNAVVEHVARARVVATTTTLAYLPSCPISGVQWSTVLVDEVTMVTPAVCLFLSSLARDRLLLAGDPRQLGPVFAGDGANVAELEWLGRDVFDKSGISRRVDTSRQICEHDSRLVRITSQRRCAADIWSAVDYLYPEVANRSNEDATRLLTGLPPSPGEAVVVLDTSDANTHCERRGGSWQNPSSAELALEVAGTLASECPEGSSVAIIAPYAAQVRLIRKSLRADRAAVDLPLNHSRIDCGTVHQFQGSDADVVIFDLVDAPGRPDVGFLLRGDTGIRLVNVAITRAKGKIIVLADKKWCEQVDIGAKNPILGCVIQGQVMSVRGRRACASHVPVTAAPRSDKVEVMRRRAESPIEAALLEALVQRGPHGLLPDAQYVIRDECGELVSRADFAYPDVKYAVYCDGRQWHLVEGRWQRDLRQRNKLAELGWTFSVFSGADIRRDPRHCAEQVWKTYVRLGGVLAVEQDSSQVVAKPLPERPAASSSHESSPGRPGLSKDSARVLECLRTAAEPLGAPLLSMRTKIAANRQLDTAIADLLRRGLIVEVQTSRGKRYSVSK